MNTQDKKELAETNGLRSEIEERVAAMVTRTDAAGSASVIVATGEGGRLPRDQVENLPDLFLWLSRFSREYCAAEGAAVAYEKAAELAEQCQKAEGEHFLTYREAGRLVGRSSQTIAKAVEKGRLLNRGRKFAPRVRASDVRMAFSNRASQGPASHFGFDATAQLASGVSRE